ncbi:MAG: NmrA family NAD(P)-binding protein, partial [Deltaproteobacteria bacterium]|nr:NmrA family NAD(P)-binding protein [Deltaproteobacteria bacterium]
MQIFVTGASGFVGGAAVRRFVREGHRVRAMARSDRSAEAVAALGAEPVRCSLEAIGAADIGDAD